MSRTRLHRRWSVTAVLAATGTAAVSVVTAAPASAGPVTTARTAAEVRTDAVPAPALAWADCGDGLQCAIARLPLDYAHPHDGRRVAVALNRLPATDPARIGSLFVNPGGPGGSGLALARAARQVFDPAVLARFDVVGFDPRGVGASSPAIACFDTQTADDQFWASNTFPLGPADEGAFAEQMAALSGGCGQHSGDLLGHVTTTDVAEDLDLLRRAVGDARLNYHGYSYGSYLGEVYANLYPDRIRSMTLDGVLDPVSWASQPLRQFSDSAASDERTFDAFARQCVAAGPSRCLLARVGQDAAALRQRLDGILARLRAHPLVLSVDPPFTFTYQIAVFFVLQELYSPDRWPEFAATMVGLEQLTAPGVPGPAGTVAARLADIPLDVANSNDAFTATFCTDTSLPRSPDAWPAFARLLERRAPTFTRAWLFEGLPCATWPARSPERYTGPFDRHTSAPVLLVNTTFDPATSYQGARRAVRRLADARLLTIDGFGHTSRRVSSACATAAMDGYLLRGALPAPGAHCAIDHGPFDPDPAPAGAPATAVPATVPAAAGR